MWGWGTYNSIGSSNFLFKCRSYFHYIIVKHNFPFDCWSWRIYLKLIIRFSRFLILLTIKPKIKMESLHILLAIFFICLTIAFCVGLWIWQFFRSTNHAINMIINYYYSFNTCLKNIEISINNLNSILNPIPSSQEYINFLWLLWVVCLPLLGQFQAL